MTNYTQRARLSAAFEAFYTLQANRHRSTAFTATKCLLYKNVYVKEFLVDHQNIQAYPRAHG